MYTLQNTSVFSLGTTTLRRVIASFLFLGIGTPLLALQGTPQIILEPIAELADPAPGPSGLLFEQFGTIDFFFGQDLRFVGIPNIDRNGDFGFVGLLGDDGIPNVFGVDPPSPFALFIRKDGVLDHFLDVGAVAPIQAGLIPGVGNFTNFVSSSIFRTGSGLTFGAVAAESSTSTGNVGVWTNRTGPIELVAMVGQTLPPLLLEVLLKSGRSFYVKNAFAPNREKEMVVLRVWDLRAVDVSTLPGRLNETESREAWGQFSEIDPSFQSPRWRIAFPCPSALRSTHRIQAM